MSGRGAAARTLLFGGSGFLGSHILARYPEIVSAGRTPPPVPVQHVQVDDLGDLRALRGLEFDRVVFAVGHSDHHTMRAERLPPGAPTPFDYHVTPLVQALEQLLDRDLRSFVHFSTILLYADEQPRQPVGEDAAIDPLKDRYAASMHLAEEACRYYEQQLPIVNVRLPPLYGPTRRTRYDLIDTLVAQVIERGEAEVWSDRTERDFLFVEDAADAVVALAETGYRGTVNLGSGVSTPVRRVIELVEEVSGCPVTVLDRPVKGPLRFEPDLTRLFGLVDWRPRTSIEDGIRRTYEGMRALQLDAARH